MRIAPWLLATLICTPTLFAQSPSTYVKDAEGWLRIENGLSFRVDPTSVSVRFHAPLVDVAGYLAGLDGDAAGLTVLRSNRLGIHDLALPAGADPLAVVAALRALTTVDFAEEACIGTYSVIPNDPSFGSLWHLHNTGQTGGTADADVDAPEAWEIQDGDPSVIVAVADSGSEHTHPDLAGNIWHNPGEVVNGIDDDGNGFIDDTIGWDFDNNDNNPAGSFYHGTAVAGVIGAVGDNGIQIVGLAGGGADGQGVSVMPLNVGSSAPNSAVLDDAIIYAADNGARVITMSLTIPSDSAVTAACDYAANTKGVFIDCASGNGFGAISYPATLPTVMAVGSTNHNDVKSGFSNFGPDLEVVAPGENIFMLSLGGGTTTQSGTSFSAPHVAALAGLLFSANPGLSAADVRAVIRSTADDVGVPGYDQQTGDGRINARAALEAVSAGFVSGKADPFGAGLAGGSGTVPVIATFGSSVPTQGDASFGVSLRQGAPSSSAWLLLGVGQAALPFKGGTLLVDVSAAWVDFPRTTTATGAASVALPVPDDALLVGAELFAQWVVQDAGAPQGYAMTAGLDLVIGT